MASRSPTVPALSDGVGGHQHSQDEKGEKYDEDGGRTDQAEKAEASECPARWVQLAPLDDRTPSDGDDHHGDHQRADADAGEGHERQGPQREREEEEGATPPSHVRPP